MTVRPARVLLSIALAGALAACGGGDDAAVAGDDPTGTPKCPITATEAPAPPTAEKDLKKKPTVAPNAGAKPTQLQYSDIVVGTGDEAKVGDQVDVKYVGAFFDTGKEFDSSWKTSPEQTFNVGLCREGTVPGFAAGPIGMKVGGRRQIVLPPEFGYGAAGQPPTIPANSTLVFIVDLVKVG